MRKYIELLRQAANDGNARAQEHLAAWLLEGLGDNKGWILKRSPAKAIRLLAVAAEAGDELAIFSLANCYADGVGVRVDRRAARKLYRQAYRRGVGLAAMNLSVLCGEDGDRRGELRWLRRAAEAGEDDAVVEVARRARGVLSRDLIRALKRVATKGPADLKLEAQAILRRSK